MLSHANFTVAAHKVFCSLAGGGELPALDFCLGDKPVNQEHDALARGVFAGCGHVSHYPELSCPSNISTGNVFSLDCSHHFFVPVYGLKGIMRVVPFWAMIGSAMMAAKITVARASRTTIGGFCRIKVMMSVRYHWGLVHRFRAALSNQLHRKLIRLSWWRNNPTPKCNLGDGR